MITIDLKSAWGLTLAEARVLDVLCRCDDVVTYEKIRYEASNGKASVSETAYNVVHHIRQKTHQYGVRIRNVRGCGYRLSESSHEIIKTAVQAKIRTAPAIQSGSRPVLARENIEAN